MAWRSFNLKNTVFSPKSVLHSEIFRLSLKAMLQCIVSKDEVVTEKGGLRYNLKRF